MQLIVPAPSALVTARQQTSPPVQFEDPVQVTAMPAQLVPCVVHDSLVVTQHWSVATLHVSVPLHSTMPVGPAGMELLAPELLVPVPLLPLLPEPLLPVLPLLPEPLLLALLALLALLLAPPSVGGTIALQADAKAPARVPLQAWMVVTSQL